MTKHLPSLLFLLLTLSLLSLSSCSQPSAPTEYTHAIPANAQDLMALDLPALLKKAELNRETGLLKHLARPQEAGIATEAPAYLFKTPSMHNSTVAVLKLDNLGRWELLTQLLAGSGVCSTPQKADGYCTTEMKDAHVGVAYNNGTLLVATECDTETWKKLQPAVDALMKQPREKSILTSPHFPALQKQKGDIRFLTTPDALSLDLRSVLKWPMNTTLSGSLQFENGRAYATLQRADFEGETNESSQPFHPQNDRELQAAVMQMSRGDSYNLLFEHEELLTLTNLRALLEISPNDPKVQKLHRFIEKVESLNVRGDGNKCSATLVLHDKTRNALSQLNEFASLLVGF